MKTIEIRRITTILFCFLTGLSIIPLNAEKVITVPLSTGNATSSIRKALEEAKRENGKPVRILFSPGTYHISRKESDSVIYHISNTTSVRENPVPMKHIGIWLQNLENVTIDGNGAQFITHGEMTTFVIDSCRNIKMRNFSLQSADPSVAEVKIIDKNETSIVFEVIEPSDFAVEGDSLFYFRGEGWIFGDGKKLTRLPQLAQVFYPEKNVTLRHSYPLENYSKVEKLGDRKVRMYFEDSPDVHKGEIYQLRHTIRNEACGFINMSKDIELSEIDFHFLGNFGIVSQFSENVSFLNINCSPDSNTQKTVAGFADFLQMSSCQGKIVVRNSRFEGSHDDPVNIHGTYLVAVGSEAPDKLTLRYSHPQTFGFTPFFQGDEIEIIDRRSLLAVSSSKVESVKKIDEYLYEVELEDNISGIVGLYGVENLAVENVTWTPEVEITGNYFARTPTRAILVTTRRKVLIADNTFFRIPMASILVADDAARWYESGPVKDITIKGNTFIECASPVISIAPEIKEFKKPVHENIVIEGNKFVGTTPGYLDINGADNMEIRNNIFESPSSM